MGAFGRSAIASNNRISRQQWREVRTCREFTAINRSGVCHRRWIVTATHSKETPMTSYTYQSIDFTGAQITGVDGLNDADQLSDAVPSLAKREN
jgi:hypothetical protein